MNLTPVNATARVKSPETIRMEAMIPLRLKRLTSRPEPIAHAKPPSLDMPKTVFADPISMCNSFVRYRGRMK